MKTLEENRSKINYALEWAYLLLFAVFFAYYFLNTTTFEIEWPEYFYSNIKILLLIVIILKAASGERYHWREHVLMGLVILVFLVSQNHNGYEMLGSLLLLLLGAKDIPFRKIIKVYFIVASLLLIITMIAALSGNITNFVLYRADRGTRIAFGSVYPTDFSAHVFYIVLSFCYLRREKIRYIEILGIALSGLFVHVFCNARLNTICIFIVVFMMLFLKLSYKRAVKKNQEIKMPPIFSMILALSTTLCAAMMIILTLLYNSNNKIMTLLDRVLSYRLMMGKKGIDLYSFSVFGQQVEMIGNGNRTTEPLNYFFIDSSYLYVALQYGLLVLAMLLFLFLLVGVKARKEKNWILLLLLAIMSLQCVVEHHLTDIAYNPFLWAAFADISEYKTKSLFIKFKEKRAAIWKTKKQ